MEPIVNIVGERVALGPIRRDLIPLLQQWSNDFAVRRTFGIPEPTTLEQQTQMYDRAVADDNAAFFTIYEHDGWRPIGFTYLEGIIWRDRTAAPGLRPCVPRPQRQAPRPPGRPGPDCRPTRTRRPPPSAAGIVQ